MARRIQAEGCSGESSVVAFDGTEQILKRSRGLEKNANLVNFIALDKCGNRSLGGRIYPTK